MDKYERIRVAAWIICMAALIGIWSKSLFWAYDRGRRSFHQELLLMWIDENGELSNAPLLVPPPWIPNGKLDNINPKRYRRGDL